MRFKFATKVTNEQDTLRFGSFLLEISEIRLWRQLPSMGIKKEATGAAKPVLTRLYGSAGREGAGIAAFGMG